MELVENPYVSDFTKRTLEQFGWAVGDAIPAELGALLVKFKETAPPSAKTDVLIDVAVLQPDQLETVHDLLKRAKVTAARNEEQGKIDAKTKNMAPGVAELYRQLNAKDAAPEIIDDRAEEKAAEAVPAPAPAPPPPEPAANNPEPVVAPPMPILPFCPRCGWDMRQKFEVDVTDRDKQDFLAALLGGQRFQRRFDIFGGKMVLTFRSLLAEENRLILRQLVLDQEAKEVVTPEEWFLRLMEYRLACSLEKIVDKEGKPLHIVAALGEFPHTPPEDKPMQTALVPLLNYVNTHVLPHEVMRRLAATHLRQFQRLVEALEAMALEPSFWNGIG